MCDAKVGHGWLKAMKRDAAQVDDRTIRHARLELMGAPRLALFETDKVARRDMSIRLDGSMVLAGPGSLCCTIATADGDCFLLESTHSADAARWRRTLGAVDRAAYRTCLPQHGA